MRDTNNQELPTLSWPWNTWGKKKKTQASLSKEGEQGEKMAEGFCH